MPRRKEQSVLELPPMAPTFAFSDTSLLSTQSSNAITPYERKIWENLREDKVIITAFDDKSRFGMEKMNEMKGLAVNDFSFTARQIEEARFEAQGTAYQAAMDEFCKYMTNLSARHTLGIVEMSASRIAEVVGESVLPPPEPRKGFFARLLGG